MTKHTAGTLDNMTLDQLRERARLNRLRGIAVSEALMQEIARREADAEIEADRYGFIQTLDTAILTAAVRGEIDLNAIARQELANRGLDHAGQWVGFPEAQRIASTDFYQKRNGRIVTVTVPR